MSNKTYFDSLIVMHGREKALEEIARGIVEQNIDIGDYDTPDGIYSDIVNVVRHHLTKDYDIDLTEAQSVAMDMAQRYAQQ